MHFKNYDVIVVGELNVDLILNNIESFPEIGKEKLAQNMDISLGSSSAIFACNLSSLGAKVLFLGKVGNDYFGQFIIDKLKERGVEVNFITKEPNLNTGATIILNYKEDRAMVTYPGAMKNLRFHDITRETLSLGKHLHFSSYFLQPGLKKDVGKMFKMAKELELTTSFDMQWDPEEKWKFNYKDVLPYVDVFLPNEKEIKYLLKVDSLEEAFKKLLNVTKYVAVKLGNKGSLLYDEGKTKYKGSFLNTRVVDAIGAGDSFNAGFIFKYINGCELSECQEFGNLMGAINTTAPGGISAFNNFDLIVKTAKEIFGYTIN